jgi:hypothetical protein
VAVELIDLKFLDHGAPLGRNHVSESTGYLIIMLRMPFADPHAVIL